MAAWTGEQRRFLERVRAFAPLAEAGGVPGAVMLAQAAVESGFGRSGLARLGNALFGVKARPGWQGKVYSGTTREWSSGRGYVTIRGTNRVYATYEDAVAGGCHPGALFRAYDTLEDNIRDYVAFFHANPRYHRALRNYALTRSASRFAVEIARAGYATAPAYARMLLLFMAQLATDRRRQAGAIMLRWNGATVPADAVRIIDDRLYVRVRRLAEARQMRVRYESATRTVHVEEGVR